MKQGVEGSVPASASARSFGYYRMVARREPMAVSSYGSIAGYFVWATKYLECRCYRHRRCRFATAELPDDTVAAVEAVRINLEHDGLNAPFDPC